MFFVFWYLTKHFWGSGFFYRGVLSWFYIGLSSDQRPVADLCAQFCHFYFIHLFVCLSEGVCDCLWGSIWQLHNSTNSTVGGCVMLLCYKHDKSLTRCSLIVPWAWNTSACCELIVTQRECTIHWSELKQYAHGWKAVIKSKSVIDNRLPK